MIRAPGNETRNVDFVETGFTGRTDFIVVRYWVTITGLPINNRFRFYGNKFKVKAYKQKYAQYIPTDFYFCHS
jgi:hypothetical protein